MINSLGLQSIGPLALGKSGLRNERHLAEKNGGFSDLMSEGDSETSFIRNDGSEEAVETEVHQVLAESAISVSQEQMSLAGAFRGVVLLVPSESSTSSSQAHANFQTFTAPFDQDRYHSLLSLAPELPQFSEYVLGELKTAVDTCKKNGTPPWEPSRIKGQVSSLLQEMPVGDKVSPDTFLSFDHLEETWTGSCFSLASDEGTDASTTGSPALQIIVQLGNMISQPPPVQAARASHISHMAEQHFTHAPEVKSLRIRLQPEELGDVEVILRRIGVETKVTISVAQAAAAEVLNRDLSLLEESLGTLFSSSVTPAVTISLRVQDGVVPQESLSFSSPDSSHADGASSGGGGSRREAGTNSDEQQTSIGMTRHEGNEEASVVAVSTDSRRVV